MSETLRFWLPTLVPSLLAIITIIVSIGLYKKAKSSTSQINEENNFIKLNEEFHSKYIDLENKYKTYESNVEQLTKKTQKLETFRNRLLLSKIFNVDITFPSIEDKLLLSNLDEEIEEPKTEVDYLLKGLIALSEFKKNKNEILHKEHEKNVKVYLEKAIKIRTNRESIDDIEKDSFLSECYNYLGVYYDENKNYQESIKNYTKSLATKPDNNNSNEVLNPNDSKPYYNLACTYAKLLEKESDEKIKNTYITNIEDNLKNAIILNPKECMAALQDYDLAVIKTEPFFLKLVDRAAKQHYKCNSFLSNHITLNAHAILDLFNSKKENNNFISLKSLAWCMDKIFQDQFNDGDAKGAWSLRNKEYVKILYGEQLSKIEEERLNQSVSESITMSSLIVRNIKTFINLEDIPISLRSEMKSKVLNYYGYLNDHFYKGFGLRTLGASGDRINISFNHNIRAILSIIWDKNIPKELKEKLKVACATMFLDIETEREKLIDQKSECLSALHLLISEYGDELKGFGIFMSKYLDSIECFLMKNYDDEFKSWDMKKNNVSREAERIDKLLFVLSDINIDSIKSEALKNIYFDSIDNLIDLTSIQEKQNTRGLSFLDGEKPDVGTTIQFIWILLKSYKLLLKYRNEIKQMINFITLSYTDKNYTKHSYSWFVSSILSIYAHMSMNNETRK